MQPCVADRARGSEPNGFGRMGRNVKREKKQLGGELVGGDNGGDSEGRDTDGLEVKRPICTDGKIGRQRVYCRVQAFPAVVVVGVCVRGDTKTYIVVPGKVNGTDSQILI